MTAAIYHWTRLWVWVTGLRISTAADRERTADRMDLMARTTGILKAEKERAEADKREAQRLLVLLSEPLKDWDLADFPGISGLPGQAEEAYRHLTAIRQGYQLVAGPVAHIRMGVTTNDMTRKRGWGDIPHRVPGQPRPTRNLP